MPAMRKRGNDTKARQPPFRAEMAFSDVGTKESRQHPPSPELPNKQRAQDSATTHLMPPPPNATPLALTSRGPSQQLKTASGFSRAGHASPGFGSRKRQWVRPVNAGGQRRRAACEIAAGTENAVRSDHDAGLSQ